MTEDQKQKKSKKGIGQHLGTGWSAVKWIARQSRDLPLRWKVLLVVVGVGFSFGVWRDHRSVSVEGLPPLPRPVAFVVLEPSELNTKLADAELRAVTPLERCRRLSLHALGLVRQIDPELVPRPEGLRGLWAKVTTQPQVSAFYAPGRDSLFLLRKGDNTAGHELVHAYDDQVGTRMHGDYVTDEALAVRSAIEGTAVNMVHGPLLDFSARSSLDENGWIMAYAMGPRYVSGHAQKIGDMIALHPKTTAEVLYGSTGGPVDIQEDTTGSVCTDRVGALGLVTLGALGGLSPEGAMALGREWRGDLLVTRLQGGERDVEWTIAVADSSSAKLVMTLADALMRTRGLTSPRIHIHAVTKDVTTQEHAVSLLDSLAR